MLLDWLMAGGLNRLLAVVTSHVGPICLPTLQRQAGEITMLSLMRKVLRHAATHVWLCFRNINRDLTVCFSTFIVFMLLSHRSSIISRCAVSMVVFYVQFPTPLSDRRTTQRKRAQIDHPKPHLSLSGFSHFYGNVMITKLLHLHGLPFFSANGYVCASV